jgi:hypothetical protein
MLIAIFCDFLFMFIQGTDYIPIFEYNQKYKLTHSGRFVEYDEVNDEYSGSDSKVATVCVYFSGITVFKERLISKKKCTIEHTFHSGLR